MYIYIYMCVYTHICLCVYCIVVNKLRTSSRLLPHGGLVFGGLANSRTRPKLVDFPEFFSWSTTGFPTLVRAPPGGQGGRGGERPLD